MNDQNERKSLIYWTLPDGWPEEEDGGKDDDD